MPITLMNTETATAITTDLSGVITADLFDGFYDGVLSMIPVCFPVVIGILSLKKGISFVLNLVRGA